jgi:retron-type reverse transcriptase
MQYSQIEIENFKQKLKQGQTLDDLVDLVNYVIEVQNQKEGTNYKLVSPQMLKHYYANINKKYVNFEIPKKTGGKRTITAPDKFLKKIQRRINLLLTLFFESKPASHGFIEGRSIVTNAKIHVGKKYVLNVDLKDFFPSIHFGRIKAVLQLPIFGSSENKNYFIEFGDNKYVQLFRELKEKLDVASITEMFQQAGVTEKELIDKKSFLEISISNGTAKLVGKSNDIAEEDCSFFIEIIEKKDVRFFSALKNLKNNGVKVTITDTKVPFGLKPEFAQIISNFCCFESKLPQGAPTSPIITNIVSQRLDYKLVKLAKEYHCFYTRYADDITFSCDKNRFKEEFLKKLEEIIKTEGFIINEKKSRIQNKVVRQVVTGITVNEKLNLPRSYVHKVRAAIHNWEKQGYDNANAKFASFYPQEKGFLRNKTIPPMESVLNGKILFYGMVRGKEDKIYLKYKSKLEELLKTK